MSELAAPESADPTPNDQAYSVSELAFALKRTIEDRFGFVRSEEHTSELQSPA